MRYLSVCSGIEAATVAWHPLDWKAVAFSEIEPFACAVLAHHWPVVPNFGDMTAYKEWPIERGTVDLLVGGTPCQSFSVAGLRAGLDDPRGSLMLVYLAIARRFAPRWVVWENVPGVLSSYTGPEPRSDLEEGQRWEAEETSDFGCFLAGLAECGYGFAYRVLDAQFFGVPQRRRRVFVVGYLGNWRAAAAVLFERESLRGYPAPSREEGEKVAGRSARSVAIRGRDGTPQAELGDEVANAVLTPNGGRGGVGVGAILETAYAVNAHGGNGRMNADETFVAGALQASGKAAGSATQQDAESGMLVAHALRADGFDASEDGTGRGTPLTVGTLSANGDNHTGYKDERGLVSGTLRGHTRPGSNSLSGTTGVRRLTPRECERLQGFPDDYTLIQYPPNPRRVKWAADGPRYRALGNSMAVPVMRWLGERIQQMRSAA